MTSPHTTITAPRAGSTASDTCATSDLRLVRRHTRDGIESAVRIFTQVTEDTTSHEAAAEQIEQSLARVASGPAPVAFKDAFKDSMTELMAGTR